MNDTAGIADERLREIVAAKSVLGSIAERQQLASELLAARQEIERLAKERDELRSLLAGLETANEAVVRKRSRNTYLSLEAEAHDELLLLDEARRNSRAALSAKEARNAE